MKKLIASLLLLFCGFAFGQVERKNISADSAAALVESNKVWADSGSGAAMILSTKRIGVGIVSPEYNLHIYNDGNTGTSSDNSVGMIESVYKDSRLRLKRASTSKASYLQYDTKDADQQYLIGQDSDGTHDYTFSIWDGSSVKQRMKIEEAGDIVLGSTDAAWATPEHMTVKAASGNVGIGTTAPDSGKLHIYGGTVHDLYLGDASTFSYADAGSGWTTSSDSTLKENITPIESIISKSGVADKIENTQLYRYNYKKESLGWQDASVLPDSVNELNELGETIIVANKDKIKQMQLNNGAIIKSNKNHYGFLAQEFGGIWENDPNKTSIDWQKVATIQWYAIQQLVETVKNHEKRLNLLEGN